MSEQERMQERIRQSKLHFARMRVTFEDALTELKDLPEHERASVIDGMIAPRTVKEFVEGRIGSGHLLWFFDRLKEVNNGKDTAAIAGLRKALEEDSNKKTGILAGYPSHLVAGG